MINIGSNDINSTISMNLFYIILYKLTIEKKRGRKEEQERKR